MTRVVISLCALFALLAGLLVFQATRKERRIVLLPSEVSLLANSEQVESSKKIRVAGTVTSEDISYQTDPSFKLSFSIKNPTKQASRSAAEQRHLRVVYNGLKPDMFASGRDVILEGRYVQGVLRAETLMTQCPSKYEPPSPEERTASYPEGSAK